MGADKNANLLALLSLAGDRPLKPRCQTDPSLAEAEDRLFRVGFVESCMAMPMHVVLTDAGIEELARHNCSTAAARVVQATVRRVKEDLAYRDNEAETAFATAWEEVWERVVPVGSVEGDNTGGSWPSARVYYRRRHRLEAQRQFWALVERLEILLRAERQADQATGIIPEDAQLPPTDFRQLLGRVGEGHEDALKALADLLGVDVPEVSREAAELAAELAAGQELLIQELTRTLLAVRADLQRIQGERDQAWTRANSAEATIDFAGRRADTAKKEAETKRDKAQAEVTRLRGELAVAHADKLQAAVASKELSATAAYWQKSAEEKGARLQLKQADLDQAHKDLEEVKALNQRWATENVRLRAELAKIEGEGQ